MNRKMIGVITLLFAVCLIGYSTYQLFAENQRSYTTIDPWFAPPADRSVFQDLSRDRFELVQDTLQGKAQLQLADVPALPISSEEASRLTGKEFPREGITYLLRAVKLSDSKTGYSVGVNEDSVLVSQHCLGRRPLPMKRTAIVAFLPFVPAHFFTDCAMAE